MSAKSQLKDIHDLCVCIDFSDGIGEKAFEVQGDICSLHQLIVSKLTVEERQEYERIETQKAIARAGGEKNDALRS